MRERQMRTKYVNWYDTTVPVGTRKRHFINYRLREGWEFWKVINYANKMFGKKPDYHEPQNYANKMFGKKPDYHEPQICEHSFSIVGYAQDVVCDKCGETCSSCRGFPGLGVICNECGTFEGIF